jgi:hypothetical protein
MGGAKGWHTIIKTKNFQWNFLPQQPKKHQALLPKDPGVALYNVMKLLAPKH